jgi:hypothetical protein
MASERFVSVNSANFEAFLQSHGFERSIQGKEVVYIRRHRNPKLANLQVKVYTTITAILPGSNENHTARDCGDDAIRVIAIYDDGKGKSFPLGKFQRVYRTASASLSDSDREQAVFTSTLDRMRLAYARLNDWAKAHPLWFC